MDGSRWTLIGRGAVILGAFNLLRLIPEFLILGKDAIGVYALLAIGDVLLSMAAIAAGRGLIHGRPWAPMTAMCSTGAWFLSSLVMFVFMWPYILKDWDGGLRPSSDLWFSPRLAFYALVVLASPFATMALIRRREPDWPSKRRMISGLVLGAVVGGAYVAGFLIVRH
jgi:hypothetical protein